MINLGWAKAKRKDNCEWTFGYVFRHDKFGDGSEINTYLVSTADGGFIEERQVDFKMVWEETICFYTTEKTTPDGIEIYTGDKLNGYDEEGIVVWSSDWTAFAVNLYSGELKGDYLLSDYLESTIEGNIYDDFIPVEVVPSNVAKEVNAKEIISDEENYEELNEMR